MWPLHPGLDNQYKLVFAIFTIGSAVGCLGASETQCLGSLINKSIRAGQF